MENQVQKENSRKFDEGNGLSKFALECREISNEEKATNFEKFLEELKKEPIDYDLSNNEVQFEVIENKSAINLSILKKDLKEKAEENANWVLKIDENGREIFSHDYLMRRKYRDGRRLYLSGEYKTAKKLFKESAEGGCIEGMHCLAIVYNNGDGCKRSAKKASYWVTMAIQNGDLEGKVVLDDIIYDAEDNLRKCLIF